MPHLFGTDGVRGRAGEYPLDHATVARIGAALVRAMRTDDRPLRVIVGRDTRESGEWIERGARSRRGVGRCDRHECRCRADARYRLRDA